MELEQEVKSFIENPIVLWEINLTQLLIEKKAKELGIHGNFYNEYSITESIARDNSIGEISRPLLDDQKTIRVVKTNKVIDCFIQEHGLFILEVDEVNFISNANKVKSALDVFKKIPLVYPFIIQIVKSIFLVNSIEEETDISYSHPDIPFSIFFSLCGDKSNFANLRVAESILHEAMHLKLTLIEEIVPLIKTYSTEVYFSPWRAENRPIGGVLHGLFVFRAILNFYSLLQMKLTQVAEQQYVEKRRNHISQELKTLCHFAESSGLTPSGSNLVKGLLGESVNYSIGSSGNLHLTQ